MWTWDFVHDRTIRGGRLKMLTVLDEHTRECHLVHVARRIQAKDVLNQLFRLIGQHGAPEYIPSDNGSEFIEKTRPTSRLLNRSRCSKISHPKDENEGNKQPNPQG